METRRQAALATRSLDLSDQRPLLPVFIQLLAQESDGQVRLAVLDTLTDMGAASEPALAALADTLRTDYGGKRNEELHQDYRAALALAAIGAPAVEELQDLLQSQQINVRADAAMALGRIGPQAAAAVPTLVLLLRDEEQRVRKEASLALGRVGQPALEPLLLAAAGDDVLSRAGAIEALGRLVAPDPRALQAVVRAASDAAPAVRAAVIKASSTFQLPQDVALTLLRENLRHDDESVRVAVANALVRQPVLLEQLEADLGQQLTAAHAGMAREAAFLLHEIGLDAAPTLIGGLRQTRTRIDQIAEALALLGPAAVELLLEAADDPSPRVRQGAALALAQIRPGSDRIVQRLAAGLDDPNRNVQESTLRGLHHLGKRARAAVPAVRQKLADGSPEIRQQAIGILVAAAPLDTQLLEELTARIGDTDPGVQRRALEAVFGLGPLGRPALPAAIAKLDSMHADVRLAAADLISSHGPAAADAVPTLAALLDSPDPVWRATIAQTLSHLAGAAQPAFEKLTQLVGDENAEVRAAAVQTLGNLELEPQTLRASLARALQDDASDVRRQALRAIRRLGRAGTIFLPDMIRRAADDPPSRYLSRILKSFEEYGTDATSVPELVELLQHEHHAVQLLAVQFLGLAGPAAQAALPQLELLREGADPELQEALTSATARIRGQPPGQADDASANVDSSDTGSGS